MSLSEYFEKAWRPVLISLFFLSIVGAVFFVVAATSFREAGIPNRCLVYRDFRCEDHAFEYVDPNHMTLRLLLRTAMDTSLTVQAVNASGYEGYASACTVNPVGGIVSQGTFEVTCQLTLASDTATFAARGEKIKSHFTILYRTDDPVLRTAYGEIADTIQ